MDDGGGFSVENLPYGVVERPGGRGLVVVVRVGDEVVDLDGCARAGLVDVPAGTFAGRLNRFFELGPPAWAAVRARLVELVEGDPHPALRAATLPVDAVRPVLPFDVADYADFYSSIHHATNLGRLMRPGAEPLLPNWRQLPVGYHGRSGTVAVSGTAVTRPCGLIADGPGRARLAPSGRLDIELEVGFVIGAGGTRIRPDDADRHVFGAVLLNDWSARDIQAFEYQPLGPFLGKSFLTTISPWVVPLDALRPFLVEPPAQEPLPDPYLRAERPWGLDLDLEVELNGTRVSATNFGHMYWTFAQQLAHLTVNGATVRAGDLIGSGTVSGPQPSESGSLIELTQGGRDPIRLADGSTRGFLLDGDTVVLRGWCRRPGVRPLSFGACAGTVRSAG